MKMYKYDRLKSHLNASPNAPQFGKASYIGQTVDILSQFSLLWCSDFGASFRKQVIVTENSSEASTNFISNQNAEVYSPDTIHAFINRKAGHFYQIQAGGMSNTYILVKTEHHEPLEDVCWNTLRMLHELRWIPSTDMKEMNALGVMNHVRNALVTWMGAEERRARIDAIPAPDIHWVWFRKPGYCLTQEIIERASSWIALNPDSRFHLWTDIPSEEDVTDFLKNIKPEWLARFRAATTIHLASETEGVMESVLQTLGSDCADTETAEGLRLLRAEFASKERQARVYKTDFFRLFVLWHYGGVYADFNDLLCLGPIKEALAIYGCDMPLGVTDLYDLNHASNYFLYSSARNAHWFDIIKDMVKHFVYLIRMVRDSDMEACVKRGVFAALESCASAVHVPQPVSELQSVYSRHELPYIGNERISDALWERILFVILVDCVPEPHKSAINARLNMLKRPVRRRGVTGATTAAPTFQTLESDTIAELRGVIEERFHASFLFWWVDYNLRVLMHYTNLPIYCRMRQLPLQLLPYGYFFSYCCMMSYVGHIGDGTSYGMDGRKDVCIANVYNEIK